MSLTLLGVSDVIAAVVTNHVLLEDGFNLLMEDSSIVTLE